MRNIPQDILKGLAIIFVIISHAFSSFFNPYFLGFIISQSIPVFILFMGFNGFNSLEKSEGKEKCKNIGRYYNRAYHRIFVPFFWLSLLAFIFYIIKFKIPIIFPNLLPLTKHFFYQLFTGHYTLASQGYYFVTLVFQFIIIFPLLYLAFKKHSKKAVYFLFLINLAFEIFARFGNQYFIDRWYISVFRFLFLIALGMWIAKDWRFNKRNKFLVSCSVISVIYLACYYIFGNFFFIQGGANNLFSASYTLLLVMLGLNYLPKENKNIVVRILTWFGRNCFIIFLIQMLVFGLVNNFIL